MSKAQKDAVLKMKPSAYKSMKLSQLGLSKPVSEENRNLLIMWKLEKWLNLNALKDKGIEIPCGTRYKGQTDKTVCRPSVRISKKTPSPLANELTDKQISNAIEIKKKGKRIDWQNL